MITTSTITEGQEPSKKFSPKSGLRLEVGAVQQPEGPRNASRVEEFLKKAASVKDFNDKRATAELETFLTTWLEPIHELAQANEHSSFWASDKGRELLHWLLQSKGSLFIAKSRGTYQDHKPLHFAIIKKNTAFLDRFLDLCDDESLKANEMLETTNDERKWNCLHAAIQEKLPCCVRMAKVCSVKTLLDPAGNGETPLHMAVRSLIMYNGPKTNSDSSTFDLFGFLKALENRDKVKADRAEVRRLKPLENGHEGKEEDEAPNPLGKQEDQIGLLTTLLTKSNGKGLSPYLETAEQGKVIRQWLEQPVTQEQKARFEKQLEEANDIRKYLRDLIFKSFDITRIQDLSKALYGTQGYEKDLCLDMSDLNQSSYSFREFVKRLTLLDPSEDPESVDKPTDDDNYSDEPTDNGNNSDDPTDGDDSSEQFEKMLFFVYLPNLNHIRKPCPHEGVRTLFWWLHHNQHVQRIKILTIPDSTTSPMSDELVERGIVNKFEIEELDWRKLDINMNVLTGSPHSGVFTKLNLYSSGNWSVLYHWVFSDDGLAKLKNLREVNINIVHLNESKGVHDEGARRRHKMLANRYKEQLESGIEARKTQLDFIKEDPKRQADNPDRLELNFGYSLKINKAASWDFPVLKYKQNNEVHVSKVQFIDQLASCHSHLTNLAPMKENDRDVGPFVKRLKEVTSEPDGDDIDKRIKVAIIDNGVDKFQELVRDKIAKGVSYVTADAGSSHRILPWWMVADPHGTQMASLVVQANPSVRLYVARVGTGRKNIRQDHAAKAVRWAVEQKVDIICISWTTKSQHTPLKDAITDAVSPKKGGRQTLVFCSLADEGNYSGKVFPVGWLQDHIMSVAATDMYGHLTPATFQTGGEATIQVPGEAIALDNPSYSYRRFNEDPSNKNPNEGTLVTGSSVATALAAGIASLALIMLKTYNDLTDAQFDRYHTKSYMQKVFDIMGGNKMGVQLSTLFPSNPLDNTKLSALWDMERIEMGSKAYDIINLPGSRRIGRR